MRLAGKVAIVTGAASGMGAATARMFAREGAKVVIADVLEHEGRQVADAIGAAAQFEQLDVTNEENWAAVVAATTQHFGRLDVLVNNAGISGSAEQDLFSTEAWHRIMAINATGVFFGIKHAIPAMAHSGGGSIVNLSSIAGIIGSEHVHMAYNASKAAVRLMTKSTAVQHAQGQHPRQLGSSRHHAADAHIRPHRRARGTRRTDAGDSRCAGRGRLTKWPMPSCSWPPMSPPTSPARRSTSMAAPSPSDDAVGLVRRWTVLVILSGIVALGLQAVRLPAALLLGPMIAAIVVALSGSQLRVAPQPVLIAQAVIGCMIARSIPPAIIGEILRDWPLFLATVIAVIAASSTLGWLLTRWRVLPGTTAVCGFVARRRFGDDADGVCLRRRHPPRGLHAVSARAIRGAVGDHRRTGCRPRRRTRRRRTLVHAPPGCPFAETLALIGFGTLAARLRRIPAAPLLLPLGAGIALQDAGVLTIELPPWLLAASYTVIGWSTGLGFNRSILAHAARALPGVVLSILVLIAVCGGLAALLVVLAGIDPLTAYLATSPGGANSAAIIAVASNVDVAFVMAMQTTRLVLVLLIGPSLAKFIARLTGGKQRRL